VIASHAQRRRVRELSAARLFVAPRLLGGSLLQEARFRVLVEQVSGSLELVRQISFDLLLFFQRFQKRLCIS